MEYTDFIYGSFVIPKDIFSIIETPVFQRLKKIKQLGLLYKIIPTGIHTRYEHCIGTYYCARKMLHRIELNTDWIASIPSTYRKAVEIAALLHDVGHGPFSHVWERIGKDFHHEKNALPCIDEIFKSVKGFECLRDENNFGIELVKSLILGDPTMLGKPLEAKYRFLFEIVNNKQCEVDVDKWDYLHRDHHHLKGYLNAINCEPNMDFDDVYLGARASANGAHIEYQYKDYEKIYSIFEARFQLHLHCYRMATNTLCDQIMREIVLNRLHGRIHGVKLIEIQSSRISEFLQLTDDMVLNMVNADEVNRWMLDTNNVEFIGNGQETKDVPKYLKINYIQKAAGSEMPSDDKFSFYGDERDMKIVNCKRGMFVRKINYRFRPVHLNNIDSNA